MIIDRFDGPHRFLSNFSYSPVVCRGLVAQTVEHAYQASKTLQADAFQHVMRSPTPGEAKRRGRRVPLRADWDDVKESVMWELLWQKFRDPKMSAALLATGDAKLIEGNNWGDTYWGQCNGRGANRLGTMLAYVRAYRRAGYA
jgi:ribA/ribD-fused uncharacterized protein